MAVLARSLALLARIERGVAVCAFLLVIVVVFADVVAREATGTGLYWAVQTGVWANLMVVAMGFGLASAHDTHLRPRFLDHWLPVRWDAWLSRTGDALTALFCLAALIICLRMVSETFALGERAAVLDVPVWIPQLMLPLMFAIATFRHACHAVYPSLRPPEAVAPPPAAQ